MHPKSRSAIGRLLALGVVLGASAASAASFSFQGRFDKDDDVARFAFVTTAAGFVEIRGFGYGGGVMDDGSTISAGGLDTSIWLFDDAGGYAGQNNDDWAGAAADPVTGQTYDSRLRVFLDPGAYLIALTQYDNDPAGANVADGFVHDGQPHYTVTAQAPFCAAGSFFCDNWVLGGASVLRSGDWAVDIRNVASANGPPPLSQVPLPAALPLFAAALLGLAAMGRGGRKAA